MNLKSYCTLHVFYKHMKFRNQARLCLAVSDFEAHIMLVWEKSNSNVAANGE